MERSYYKSKYAAAKAKQAIILPAEPLILEALLFEPLPVLVEPLEPEPEPVLPLDEPDEAAAAIPIT